MSPVGTDPQPQQSPFSSPSPLELDAEVKGCLSSGGLWGVEVSWHPLSSAGCKTSSPHASLSL